jgi:hypothetical protein
MGFIDQCKNAGMELLRDDVNYIRDRLKNMPRKRQILVLRRYREIWLESMRACENAQIRQSVGRKKANLFLLDIK